jgi:hypothetical protein
MPDLLRLETSDWALRVWSKDISKAGDRLQKTLAERNAGQLQTAMQFNPPLPKCEGEYPDKTSFEFDSVLPCLTLSSPIFFENKPYEFEFEFTDIDEAIEPQIYHRLRAVEESFHYRKNSLRGTINTANDIGWFRLRLAYKKNGKPVEQAFSFEVLPTKMDMTRDVQNILQVVDEQYPLWRFAFAQKTEYELAQSRKPHERFPLLWLAHFKSLQSDLQKAVKQIINAPHTRLLPIERFKRADRLKGKLPYKLEEKITGHIQNGEYHHRYAINAKQLSVDTPENRFIKMVLVQCVKQLIRIGNDAKDNNKAPDQQRLSDSFYQSLENWKKPLEQFLNRPLFADVGDFTGMSKESLVLHQKSGYANVYRIWQQLKLYLDVFGNNASVSMKTVAELYEVWCLLEIRGMLLCLGFEEKQKHSAQLKTQYLEKRLNDGIGASFEFEREGVKIRLAHEPVFSKIKNTTLGIHSWTTTQKPDIYLEATFTDGKKIQWIFDAKYRIADDVNNREIEPRDDFAPDDAINQMHRYRDALIQHTKTQDGNYVEKSRPVLGAYVLYPGWFDQQQKKNPYNEAIEKVGIGAFALLPGQQNEWLFSFLKEKFGVVDTSAIYQQKSSDIHFVEDAARIAYQGMSVMHYQDLALVTTAAPVEGREQSYIDSINNGVARWYHMCLEASQRENIQQAVMREIRFCAIAVVNSETGNREIHFVYPVKSVRMLKRRNLSVEQTGKEAEADKLESDYWLFQLGVARELNTPIIKNGIENHHYMKLTNENQLNSVSEWVLLEDRYSFFKSTSLTDKVSN